MSKFTFTQEFYGFGSPKTTVEFEADQLNDVLENFTNFLRGCGFQFDGHLEIAQTTPSEINTNSTDAKIDLDAFTNSLFTMHSDSTILPSAGRGIDTITLSKVPFGIDDNYIL